MRALVLHAAGSIADAPLRIVDRIAPSPGRDELRLRVTACAVCRTDLQIVSGDLAAHRLPLIPGHQVVGTVEAIGEAVPVAGPGGWRIGDRVGVTWLAGFDGTCRFCREGRENLCRAATFTGWDRDGGYAESMTVRADVAVHLGSDLPDEGAAPLLCGGVIGYRALRLSVVAPDGIRAGGRLGLYGFGASALQAIQVARHWGCEVHVASRTPADLERATAFGAASVGGYDEAPPRPLDAAITFAPVGSVVVAALRALDRGGTVVINAIHLDGMPAFPYDDLWWERSIRSVANVTRRDAQEYLDLAAAIPIRTETEIHPLEQGNEALARLERGEIAGSAVLVPWDGGSRQEVGTSRRRPRVNPLERSCSGCA
ncbi:MAG TPA: zinc-dependent alcohol dehydrogenase family protein [Candidatus Binatus sp.]|nr:zinc-dependent alcohol dehydrogenase family protein [Candidatus Binatus sp.]